MTQSKNGAIQGLRFLAISLIIASHCGFLMQGGLGNTIFFAMSGFFLCRPYASNDYEDNYFNVKNIFGYYKKRLIRIIPACWICMLFAAFGLRYLDFRDFSTENSLLLNMFFIKSKNHLWFLQQEIVFYLIAPFLILVIALIKKLLGKIIQSSLCINILIFALLNVAVALTYRYRIYGLITLYANGGPQFFRIWLFLIGMSFAYLFKCFREFRITDRAKNILNVLGTVFVSISLLLTILSSEQILSLIDARFSGLYVGWTYDVLITYIASAVLVVLSLLGDNNICKRFLGNRLFTIIGNASFSLYLIHGCLIPFFAELSVPSRLISVYAISLAIALCIYKYVEQPLIKRFS